MFPVKRPLGPGAVPAGLRLKDAMISELCDLDRSLMLSIDILPVPTDEAVREVQNKLLGVETNAGATRS